MSRNTQFSLLLAGASAEGLAGGVEPAPEDFRSSPEFRQEWEDLLASIALFGPARAVLPAHMAAEVDISALIELGLAEILTLDLAPTVRRQVSATYQEAFSLCRQLEVHRVASPRRSLDAPMWTPSDALDARLLAADADYYVQRLDEQIEPLLHALHAIFGRYVEGNYEVMLGALHDFVEDAFPVVPWTADDVAIRTPDLFRSMGLYVRDAGLLEASGNDLRQPGISYTPEFLTRFAELDRQLTSRAKDFASFSEMGLILRQFDWADFVGVHTFWRSFFELMNMLAVADATNNPLYLPGSAVLRDVPAPSPAVDIGGAVGVYRLFLAENGRMPSPTTLRQVQQLRRDPGLKSLRVVLGQWTEVARGAGDNDAAVLAAIRRDVETASKRLKRAEHLSRAGKVVSLVGLPVAVYDTLKGSALGLSLAPIGPAIDGYGARQLRKAGWVRFGHA